MERTVANGCRRLIEVCADLKPHETALVITDQATREIGEELTNIARTISTNVQHVVAPAAEMHGKEPPADIAEKMSQADVIFGLRSMSMAHTQARHQASLKGARYLSLPDYTPELLKRPALYVDFRKITPLSDYLANLFTAGKKVRVMTSLGTDLTLNITGRQGNSAPGWCFAKGILSSPPDAEVNVPPIETDTEGTLVVDGSMPCRQIGMLSEPVILQFKQGRATAVSGKQAPVLEELFNSFNNPLVRVAAEFGIGLNPAAELIGSMLEDEGCLGTIHVGIGSNITIGGLNKVPFHLDTIVRNATIYIDDRLIMRNGILEEIDHVEVLEL